MNIESYTDYFHDGCLLNFVQNSDQLLIYLESAEIEPDFGVDPFILSEDKRIRGTLRVDNNRVVLVDGKIFTGEVLS